MKSRFLLCASAALLPAFPAFAQDRDDEIVVVATGVEQSADETGRSITVLNREEIDQRQTVVLSDLLATTAGVTVTRNGGMGGFTGVRIRGAEAEQTLILIDGVRVNDPSAPGGGFDFANLLAGSAERVEVLRGPNSVAWGSQAVGGVVNVITQRADSGFAARANAEYGSLNSFSGNAALSGGNETFQIGATAGYSRTDGVSSAAVGTEADGYRQFGASGRVKVNLAPGLSIDLRGYYADSRAELDGYPAPTYAFADTSEYSTAKELYGYAGLNAELFDGKLRNRVAVTLADIDRDNYNPAFGTAPGFFGRGNSERYEYQGDLTLSKAVRAVFGAEHEDSRFNDGTVFAATGNTSFYGELLLTPVEMLSVTGGVRHDDHRDFGGHTSFGASAVVRPLPGMAIHASYGEGFKAPTLYQLYSFYGTRTLRPETATSYEAGVRQEVVDGVTLGATWFHRDTTNQIDFDLGTFRYANIARTRAEGVELELVAQPVSGLSVRASYTHVDTENRVPGGNFGRDLARRPQDSGSVSADYRFGFGLGLGATVLMVSDSFDNPGNTVRLKGYTLTSIRAEMPIAERFSLYGRVENLFDEKYQTVATYGTPGRTAYAGIRLRFD